MSTERKRIDTILRLVGSSPIASGAGVDATHGLDALDDCAVIPVGSEQDLVIGSDFVRGEGFHLFRLGLLNYFDIGWYLVGANASDLAAMGAAPFGLVSVVRYRNDMSDEEWTQVMSGIVEACRAFQLPLLGGDTGSYDSSVLSASAIGLCPHGKALLRSEARPGDRLFLTGDVGVAGAALAYFLRAKPAGHELGTELEQRLLDRWRRVSPALPQGQGLVANGLSRCAIDTSDGLKASCAQIARASKADLVVKADKIPFTDDVRRVADCLAIDPIALALSDSVDFRLLFSVPPEHVSRVQELFEQSHWPLFEIGYVREPIDPAHPSNWLEGSDGAISPMPGVEWSQSAGLAVDGLKR